MSVKIAVSGAAAEAVDRIVPQLVSDLVASRITGGDETLWGPDAESEASKRLGWVEAVTVSRPMVDDIYALRDKLRADGVNHIVLGGMGGSSLAPEVIARTYGVELTVLDSTDPGQVLAALGDRLATTAVVISSKSGSTVETDSQKRIYEKFFSEAGIDPLERKRIQRGVGMWVPNEMLGMHVGARRSHTTGRSHSIELRTLTALFGWMGVECDPRQLNDHEQRVLGEAIALHKQHRALLHGGEKPNCAPELNATIFTGPGVIDAANANAAIETIRLIAHLLQPKEQGAHGIERPIPGIEENAPVI